MEEYDRIIVGAGTAGCVLAARLSADAGARVLLLEAGSAERTPAMTVPNAWPQNVGSAADWGYVTTAQAEAGPVPYPRGRALGGSSAINAMAHTRGHPAVYDGWAAAGAPGWGFADLLPYFRRTETAAGRDPVLRGTDGPVRVAPVPRRTVIPSPARSPARCGRSAARPPATSAAPYPRERPGPTWRSPAGSGSARPMPTCARYWPARGAAQRARRRVA